MTLSQRSRSVLARAAAGVLYRAGEGDDKAKGGADAKADADNGDKTKADAPAKIELTEDELQARINAALTKEREKRAKDDAKAKEDADRKKAEQDGEFQKLAADAQAKREAAERERDAARLDKRKLEVKDRLRDYLAEKHPAYATAAKWVMPAVEFDLTTDDKDIDKRIAAAADAYVKDNPRASGTGGGAPGRTGAGNRAGEGEQKKKPDDTNNRERAYSIAARRAF